MAAEAAVEEPEAPQDADMAAPVAAPPAKDAEDKKGSAKEAKGKKEKKGKKGKEGKEEQVSGDAPSIAGHPRAKRSVAKAKGWGGLCGFLLGGYLSMPTGTLAEAGLRALLAGIVGYVALWAGSVFLWKRLVMLEIKAREQELLARAAPPAGAGQLLAEAQRPGRAS